MREPNYYAAPGFERAGLNRKNSEWLLARLTDPATRFLPVWRAQSLVVRLAGETPRAALLGPDSLAPEIAAELAAEARSREIVLLGIEGERAYFAVDLSEHEEPLGLIATDLPVDFADLRQVGLQMERREGALLAYARGIVWWHARHRFCGVCGAATVSAEAGHVRHCTNPACRSSHFPRTDPAVIMLVVDGDRCLLGRQSRWPPGQHSTLAGFVEPGESLEDAVAREVKEETGIEVTDVVYHSSQPWPFPSSLMLGFHARAVSREIRVDPHELEAAHWFQRDWILAQPMDDGFRLPRADSISRRLIEDWLHGRAGQY